MTAVQLPPRSIGPADLTRSQADTPQQPQWSDHPRYSSSMRSLSVAPALVPAHEIAALRRALRTVAEGEARVLQAGDCAESFYECTRLTTDAKMDTLNRIADQLATRVDQPVIRIGRIAGQYAKPRSSPFERHGDVTVPAFRGHMVNGEETAPAARSHDPRRMLWAYHASARILDRLSWHRAQQRDNTGPWSSHEALVLDYEAALLREDAAGTTYLASTHLPWIGKRTADIDGAHARLLAQVANPVGLKVASDMSVEQLVSLCETLDPLRSPGRLVLIARMGQSGIGAALPGLVEAVRRAGHPAVWVCDPMHGNTVTTADGMKTRYLTDVIAEATTFNEILADHQVHSGGLHLESAAQPVTECVGGGVEESELTKCYATLCDPRLSPRQAVTLIEESFGSR